jgi:hypothetical protein
MKNFSSVLAPTMEFRYLSLEVFINACAKEVNEHMIFVDPTPNMVVSFGSSSKYSTRAPGSDQTQGHHLLEQKVCASNAQKLKLKVLKAINSKKKSSKLNIPKKKPIQNFTS